MTSLFLERACCGLQPKSLVLIQNKILSVLKRYKEPGTASLFFDKQIGFCDSTVRIMICIHCCTSAEDNRIMLAENLAVRSVKSHNSNSNCHDAVPRTTRCLDGKTWQLKQALVTQWAMLCLLSQK